MPGDDRRRWLEALAEPLVVCDAHERIQDLNPAAERLLGWSAHQLVGQAFSCLLEGDPARGGPVPFLHAALERAPGGQAVRSVVRRRDGTPWDVELTVGHAGEGDTACFSVLLRHPAEARDLAGERAHQLVFDNAPLGLLHFDEASTLVACNDYFTALMGSERARLVGLKLLGLPDETLVGCVRDVLDGKHAYYEGDYRATTSGKVTPVRVHFAPCVADSGQVQGGVGIVEDITGQRAAENERVRLLREAQDAIRVRDDFLTIASHELKTPLTPLSLRLAGLERRLERQEPVDPTLLRHARQHLMRLTALINDLLDASRIEAGRLALQFEPARLDSIVERALVSMDAERGQHRIDYTHPEEPVRIRADVYRLEQVIANLLENALKYSPGTSTVRVSLDVRGDFALLTVADEGIGIPKDQQEQLFERYFRARNVSITSYGGLGLGLYISRDIVERHGGRIWVESELGRGATFYVAVPLQSAVNPAPPEPHLLSQHVH